MTIDLIIQAINKNRYRVSKHALIEMRNDEFDLDDVLYSIENGKIIEDYPDDKRSPSCLVFGYSYNERPIHSVWGYMDQVAICITVYEPDPKEWINNEVRKKQ
jgi:hypothetical protein